MSLTAYGSAAILRHILKQATLTPPSAFYVSLATSLASSGLLFNEVAGGTGYARVPVTFGAVVQADPSTAANSFNIDFSEALTPWGTVTHFGITDASTNGNLWMYAPLTLPKTIPTGQIFRTPVGELILQLS